MRVSCKHLSTGRFRRRVQRLMLELRRCGLVGLCSRAGLCWLVGLAAAWGLGGDTRCAAQTPSLVTPAAEPTVDQPLPAEEAAESMLVPPGFQVTLFAGEPAVQQPINFCVDDRGRLWVAEAYNYPRHGTSPGDRIIILTDSDGDGRHDQRTVFLEGLNYVTGIEVGFGGAWIMSPPYFYFVPDRNGDDQPDGPPEVVLDGFGNHANAHNLANGFAWGPDGWLYGTHGRTNWSRIGRPGATDAERVVFDGGVWRFHPTRRTWEPFADGTTNPWGIDWNELGDAFVSNCVTPHLYHVIPGAHYEPWRNRESSRYAYARIPAIADHLHFVGQGNVREGLFSPAEDAVGGGHAHCGALIYLGDSWPAQYRNTFFTCNIHGKRINNDLPERAGSGYVAHHGPDLMRARDPWFVGVTLQASPDGAVFVSDWSDTGECHHVTNTQRSTGRIFKLNYGNRPSAPVDLTRLSAEELVQLHTHANEWHVRHARRILQERQAAGLEMSATVASLQTHFRQSTDIPRKLRYFWTLMALNALDEPLLLECLGHASENVRAWAVRASVEPGGQIAQTLPSLEPGIPPTTVSAVLHARFVELAAADASPYVRLAVASAMQRLGSDDRWSVAVALLSHLEDAQDPNLPLMAWYGIEPLVDVDRARFAALLDEVQIPLVAEFIARRLSSHPHTAAGLPLLVERLGSLSEPIQAAVLRGALTGLEGQRVVQMPADWPARYAELRRSGSAEVVELAGDVALVFDDPVALADRRRLAADVSAPGAARRKALDALLRKQVEDLAPELLRWIDDGELQQVALRGLSEYQHPETSQAILAAYARLPATAKLDAVQTLASRPAWAAQLLDAVEAGRVDRGDITAYAARQVYAQGDAQLRQRLAKVWGEVRTTSADKLQQIRRAKGQLTPTSLAQADRSAGRALFVRTCANCHRLFGEGGDIGPDLTGAQRRNLDYLLQTLIDPSAEVARDYQLEHLETNTGRVLSGIVVDESDQTLTLQSVNERLVLPRSEIAERQTLDVSMMPEGMLQNLTPSELRQLIAYLMGTEQVPLKVPQ